ncbi:hypothetical protein FKM82_000458 [Ascaphus truei]
MRGANDGAARQGGRTPALNDLLPLGRIKSSPWHFITQSQFAINCHAVSCLFDSRRCYQACFIFWSIYFSNKVKTKDIVMINMRHRSVLYSSVRMT